MAGADAGFKVDEWGEAKAVLVSREADGIGEQVVLEASGAGKSMVLEAGGIWDRHEVLDNKVPFQEIIVQTAADFH